MSSSPLTVQDLWFCPNNLTLYPGNLTKKTSIRTRPYKRDNLHYPGLAVVRLLYPVKLLWTSTCSSSITADGRNARTPPRRGHRGQKVHVAAATAAGQGKERRNAAWPTDCPVTPKRSWSFTAGRPRRRSNYPGRFARRGNRSELLTDWNASAAPKMLPMVTA